MKTLLGMKMLVLLCLVPLVQSEVSEMFEQTDGSTLQLAMSDRKKGQEEDEQTFDNEDGSTLTMVMRAMDAAEDRDEGIPNFETLIQHDCNTIRDFDRKNLDNMEDWIVQGRTKHTFVQGRTKDTFVKYNHAYGIPILGNANFTDDSMRRACYLVRFLFAGNEHFRRYAYKTKMYIRGEVGGFCCPPNVGNPGLSCPCGKERNGPNKEKNNVFPGPQIFTPAHEMAHWYILRVLPLMEKAGELQLPQFVNSTEWSWKKPDDEICKGVEKRSNTYGLSYEYLWNALQQDYLKETTGIARCNVEHYFIYTGQDKFLGLSGGGEAKEQARNSQKETNPNLYNLLKIIWPCNNHYISVCEDSAHGMTKGLAQQLKIGRSISGQPSKMKCLSGVDTAEVDMTPVSDLPADDVVYKEENEEWNKKKCLRKTKEGGWLGAEDTFEELETGEVAKSLGDSNEYAWWLRKCCAKSAKFF